MDLFTRDPSARYGAAKTIITLLLALAGLLAVIWAAYDNGSGQNQARRPLFSGIPALRLDLSEVPPKPQITSVLKAPAAHSSAITSNRTPMDILKTRLPDNVGSSDVSDGRISKLAPIDRSFSSQPYDASNFRSRLSIQIGAFPTLIEAEEAWNVYKIEYPLLLGKYGGEILRDDLGRSGIWYRLRISGVPDQDTARKLCARLKENGGNCFLAKVPSN